MAAIPSSWILPIPPKITTDIDSGSADVARYDEVWLDNNTQTYKTRHQQDEINSLKELLEEKKIEREKSLKSIIGYFYKR